jgi:GTP1/Obg family GTP-binding protein
LARNRASSCLGRKSKARVATKIEDVEQKKRFLVQLRLELRRLCVVRTYIDIE